MATEYGKRIQNEARLVNLGLPEQIHHNLYTILTAGDIANASLLKQSTTRLVI